MKEEKRLRKEERIGDEELSKRRLRGAWEGVRKARVEYGKAVWKSGMEK